MKRYNPTEIEPKWQQNWTDTNLYAAKDFDTKQKFVMLTEFPYPSGEGLHLGHVREYTLGDIVARHKRMMGYNVLYPMGYDAFGLPTENYAIKHKIPPQLATERNVANFRKQFDSLGLSIDWDRSFKTTDPDYYKWTQWLFLQFFKEGLAYQEETAINWCPHCKTGLANEEVVNGRHERCDTLVEKKRLKQWMLKITKYADRLIEGLQDIDFPSRIADQQINWIGRSKGAEVNFAIEGSDEKITVFTTRIDTLFGVTFLVLAPEHPLIEQIVTSEQRAAVNSYIKATQAKSEIERQDTSREKTGEFTGAYAINPANGEKVKVWVADYVLAGYGTGAVMAVPGHDARDFAFAKKYELPVEVVVAPVTGKQQPNEEFRRSIVAIVRHPKTGKFLSINWGKLGGNLFVGGGREEDEDITATAKREILEETGYANLELIAKTTHPVRSHYYAHSKKVARHIEAHGLFFELKDDVVLPTALEANEQGKFKVEWISPQEVESKIIDELHAVMYRTLVKQDCYSGEGVLVNSGEYTGVKTHIAREQIMADLAKKHVATEKTTYKLRDWIFSRQHYWGEPIPVIHCVDHGAVAVPEADLPVELPPVDHYEPTETGESPLAEITDWVNTTCPTCGKPAKRETDTMPNWAGSSWYYMRYFDAKNDSAFAAKDKLEYWRNIDVYLGGMEHTTLHLLYSRFWHQFFYDQGLVPTPEPYQARRGQGIVLAADGSKMSKSKGNVINPNEIIDQGYGADALRLSIAFLAPYDQTTPWNPEGVAGTFRFLQRIWTLTQEQLEANGAPGLTAEQQVAVMRPLHAASKKVGKDLDSMDFNTAIAALMECVNALYKAKVIAPLGSSTWAEALAMLVRLVAPFAPHMAEELWAQLGGEGSVHIANWPVYDAKILADDTVKVVVQVNGKVRATMMAEKGASQEAVVAAVLEEPVIAKHLDGKMPARVVFVPNRLVNLVIK